MKRILAIISVPFIIIGLLLWSAVTFARAAFSALFVRRVPVSDNPQP